MPKKTTKTPATKAPTTKIPELSKLHVVQPDTLSFTIETFDDPEIDKPTEYGRFSRNWIDEEALDVLLEKLQAGYLSDKQALTQALKLEATTPYNLEIQNFIGNRLSALGMDEEASEVYERAYQRAVAHIPKGFEGQILWGEIENRPFLRLAHGTLLSLMRKRGQTKAKRVQVDRVKAGQAAEALANQLLAWCPTDNLGVRYLLGDIALLQGDLKVAMKEYLKEAPNSPENWYQAALISFRQEDYVSACTYVRRGIAANPYIAEGLTGRTVLAGHLYWHGSNVYEPDWAIDYLESAASDWTLEEIDFVDWVFNASPVLKERAQIMALREEITYERDPEKRASIGRRLAALENRITNTLSKKMVVKVKNPWDEDIWPWDREGFEYPRHR